MFQVRCLYHAQGCLWSEALQELTEHTANCGYVLQECEYCHEKFAKSKVRIVLNVNKLYAYRLLCYRVAILYTI